MTATSASAAIASVFSARPGTDADTGAAPHDRAPPERRLANRLTAAYVAALALIALLSGVTHLLLDRAIVQQQDAATVINVAGRQRMLSQRIGMLAGDLRHGDTTAAAPLLAAIVMMDRAHFALLHRNDLSLSSLLSEKARAHYYGGEDPLDAYVRRYLKAARTFHAAPQSEAGLIAYNTLHAAARSGLLSDLNHAVVIFEEEANRRIGWLQTVQTGVFVVMLLTLALEAMLIFRPLVSRVRSYAGRLYEMATRDALTGLPNRRHFREAAERELLLAQRSRQPIALLALDIDHFKRVNDSHGHATGDALLVRFGQILQQNLRRSDIIGRIGGEEFAVLLPGAGEADALAVAEMLRAAVEDFDGAGGTLPRFTVSAGLVQAEAVQIGQSVTRETLDMLMARADAGLYQAKDRGRNCVVAA